MISDFDSLLDWVCTVRGEVADFMLLMKKRNGTFKYTLSGDLYPENTLSNLGANVFALKIFYVIGLDNKEEMNLVIEYVKRFQGSDGLFLDKFVFNRSFLRNFAASIKRRNFINLTNWQYKVAETRQCISALGLFNEKPIYEPYFFPTEPQGVIEYLEALNWRRPWDAGSHFSHLCFFLKRLEDSGNLTATECLNNAFDWIDRLQDSETGCWWKGSKPSDGELVNGAMKILTGYEAAARGYSKNADSLINFCLNLVNNTHACGNFNILYVLDTAYRAVGNIERRQELEAFIFERLKIFRTYWYPEYGGFSFFQRKSSDNYYGARVSRGLNEPDIHGTVLFIWGLSLISRIMNLQDESQLRPFIT